MYISPYLSNYLIVSQFDWQSLSLLPFFSIFVFDARIQSLPHSSSTSESVILNNKCVTKYFVYNPFYHINMIQVFSIEISAIVYYI